jgi:hypothetical protein
MDLKPSNLLLHSPVPGSRLPVLKVADFGFAHCLGRHSSSSVSFADLRIRDILLRIRIRGSVPLTNGDLQEVNIKLSFLLIKYPF